MVEILKKIEYQESQNLIMDNLGEILISKSKKKIYYVNKKGYELIENIYFDVLDKYINDNNQNNLFSSVLLIERNDFDPSM